MQEFRRVNQFAMLMLAVMVLGSGMVAMVMSWLGTDHLLVRYILVYGLQFVCPVVLYCVTIREYKPGEILRLGQPKVYTYVLVIIFAVAIQPFLMCVSSLTSIIFKNYVNASMAKYLENPLWLTLISAALIPAVCEELLCRGVYLSGCRRLNIYLSAALNGAFFGILHMNPQQSIYAAIFGFLCALIAIGANSVWPAIVAHFLINGTQLILAYVQAWLPEYPLVMELMAEDALWKMLPTAILLAAVAVWCLVRIFYVNGRHDLLKKKSEMELNEAFPGLCWFGGLVAGFVIIIIMVGI
ncbi:MAG: CPBP family intramembrane metalloprotease [Firmicutes bacterium]|nr:CPBP family intramembrane metalloprotease [Bacillota bacterium]